MNEQLLNALKWIGIVFVAGFIGYFGRYLSMMIIERLRRGKSGALPATDVYSDSVKSTITESAPADLELEKEKTKLEKKKLKLEKKAQKKKGQAY